MKKSERYTTNSESETIFEIHCIINNRWDNGELLSSSSTPKPIIYSGSRINSKTTHLIQIKDSVVL